AAALWPHADRRRWDTVRRRDDELPRPGRRGVPARVRPRLPPPAGGDQRAPPDARRRVPAPHRARDPRRRAGHGCRCPAAAGRRKETSMSEVYRGTWVVAYREVLRFVSDRVSVLASLVFPLLFLAIFGAGFSDVVWSMPGGVYLIVFMSPGIIAQSVLISALSTGMSVVSDREFGYLKEILVTPVSRTGIVLGKVAGAGGVALVQVFMLLVVAPIVGVHLDADIVLELVPVVIILTLGLSGLGILIASFMRSQQSFQLLLQLLVFPMVFLAGVFFPVDTVPTWMAVLSKVNPVTYGVDAIRQIFLGSGPARAGLGVTVLGHTMTLVEDVAVVGVVGILLLASAVWAFSRQE